MPVRPVSAAAAARTAVDTAPVARVAAAPIAAAPAAVAAATAVATKPTGAASAAVPSRRWRWRRRPGGSARPLAAAPSPTAPHAPASDSAATLHGH